jgi:hypothetical protein
MSDIGFQEWLKSLGNVDEYLKKRYEIECAEWDNNAAVCAEPDKADEELICDECGRNETECEAQKESEVNPITNWQGFKGVMCDDCYYREYATSEEEDEEDEPEEKEIKVIVNGLGPIPLKFSEQF